MVTAGRVLILSGAGLSTESGIPDYRGPTGLARRAQPMTYQVFTGSAAARRRYWARSYLGWQHIARAAPNDGHRAVAELSRRGLLTGIITQNVDGLHQAAGAFGVTELHGSLHRVICLSCGQRTARTELERRVGDRHPGRSAGADADRPGGRAWLAAMTGFDVVTGAFGYSGAAIARELQAAGRPVRTLTNHPGRGPQTAAAGGIEVRPLDFA